MNANVRLLISQLRAVQRAHRAGITPPFGELDNLFETVDRVERELDSVGEVPAIATTCDTDGCGRPSVRLTTDGRRLCVDCAAKLIAATLFGDSNPLSLVLR